MCSINSKDTAINANVSSNIEILFDKNDFIDKINGTIFYKFDNKTNYNKWKRLYNLNSHVSFIDFDFNGKYEFNDSDNSLKLVINQVYSEIPKENLNNDFPTNYVKIKSYFHNLGYTCNGEKPEDTTNNFNDDSDTGISDDETNELISITDTISGKNNLFEYKNYKYEYNEKSDSAIIWLGSITNISNENLHYNIRVRFYDVKKNCIGDYQYKTENQIEDTDLMWVVAPNETKNISFTIYDDCLYEDKNLSDVKYISIEDIEFNK